MSRKCIECGSRWPALVTIEAFHNYDRIDKKHKGERCRDVDGEFGPKVRPIYIAQTAREQRWKAED